MFQSTLDYKFLFNYLQLWRSYAILSATTKFTSYVQNVHHWLKRTLAFFPNSWKFLVQILHTYYKFLSMLHYKFLHNYLQLKRSYAILSATTQRAFQPMVDILSIWWWSRLIWHNFVKVADNWIKICSPVQIETYNRCVKFGLKIPNCSGKNVRKN